MALVVLPVVPPSVLRGQENGRLDPAILVSTPGLAGGPTVRLVSTAARCWQAMTAAATADGVTLQTSSYADSYRTYQVQVATFTARYQVEPTGNGWRLWDSDGNGTRERWYKKDGVASAAVPGTSNHGWAIAVDVANASGRRLAWLEAHAVTFGWSWELIPEEPWHLRNVTGDNIPPAVLAFEEADMEQTEKLIAATGFPDRRVGDHFGDLQNLREYLYAAPGATSVNPPPAGSRAALLVAAAEKTLASTGGVDVDALADAIAANLVADTAFLAAVADAVLDAQAQRLSE